MLLRNLVALHQVSRLLWMQVRGQVPLPAGGDDLLQTDLRGKRRQRALLSLFSLSLSLSSYPSSRLSAYPCHVLVCSSPSRSSLEVDSRKLETFLAVGKVCLCLSSCMYTHPHSSRRNLVLVLTITGPHRKYASCSKAPAQSSNQTAAAVLSSRHFASIHGLHAHPTMRCPVFLHCFPSVWCAQTGA